ncbi:MAG TPA: acylphosphatase [Gammaproteobacteria bacterium]|nr:acylphosphatase [Gammaproteobacteria bacterium]
MVISRKIFISGRVQGVFFRESTRQKADDLKLQGGVRNLNDGRVEVQVTGQEERVQRLIKWLKMGPKFAKVSTIEVIEMDVSERTDDPSALQQNAVFDVWSTK